VDDRCRHQCDFVDDFDRHTSDALPDASRELELGREAAAYQWPPSPAADAPRIDRPRGNAAPDKAG
jgi:hypothetical protein